MARRSLHRAIAAILAGLHNCLFVRVRVRVQLQLHLCDVKPTIMPRASSANAVLLAWPHSSIIPDCIIAHQAFLKG